MKRLVLILMAVIIAFSFVACGQTNNSTDDTQTLQSRIDELEKENSELKSNTNISDSTSSESSKNIVGSDNLNNDEMQKYIDESMELVSAKVEFSESYSWSGAGLLGVELKNNGDKTVKSVTVTVYFKNESGSYNAEKSTTVMSTENYIDRAEPLKPNYSWKMEDGKFYQLENLSSEVDITNYDIAITKIEFK